MKKTKYKSCEYNIKVKKRILSEIIDSDKKFITTYKEIKNYFKIFNKTLFKDKLNKFNDIKIKRIVRGSGLCVEHSSYRKGTSFFVLEMMPKYKNKLEFFQEFSSLIISSSDSDSFKYLLQCGPSRKPPPMASGLMALHPT